MNEAGHFQQGSSFAIGDRLAAVRGWIVAQFGQKSILGLRIFSTIFVATFIVGFLVLICISPKYSAMTIIGPQSSPQGDSSLDDLSAHLGGVGSLLGVKEPSNNLTAFQSLLGTAEFAQYLMVHNHIDKIFFPHGIHHSVLSIWLHAIFGQPVSNGVTVSDVQTYLQENIYIRQKVETPYVDISYTNKNRADAIKTLQILLSSGDKVLRQREGASLDVQIAYLSRVLRTTTDIEQLNLFRKLLGEKLASKVLIDTQKTYAFKVFDAPFAPLVPNSPNISILVILLFVFSLLFAAMIIVSWLWWYKESSG